MANLPWFKFYDKPKNQKMAARSLLINYDILRKNQIGNIYLVRCQNFHKIGIATSIHQRMYQLSTANPYPIELVIHKEIKDCRFLEKTLHTFLEHQRVRGEWFELPPSMVEVVKLVITQAT